jgi:endonuclease/exonuclease/phosphatase family metal-dependent hydrolase
MILSPPTVPPDLTPDPTMPSPALTCVTWNIHRGRGVDGRVDAGRVAQAIADELCRPAPDILALQEADEERPPYAGFLPIDRIAADTGLSHALPPDLRWGSDSHGFHGNIVFLAPRLVVSAGHLLDLPGHYPRGAVVLDLDTPLGPLRVINLHLSLSQPLRVAQMRTLGQHLDRRPAMPTLLLGDLNEWRPWGGLALSARVAGRRFHGPTLPTFPARRPVVPLDRILCDQPRAVTAPEVLSGPLARSASDHRPLRAVLSLDHAG